jgi:hypothetical protein
VRIYYNDSEGDENVISEDDDFQDALTYKQLKNIDILNLEMKIKGP